MRIEDRVRIHDATADHVAAITAIYNDAVENTTAIWNDQVVDYDNRARWLMERTNAGFPVLVCSSPNDEYEVLGYATYAQWRPFDGYRHTVEHSVYVRNDQHGKGIGTMLMERLIERAQQSGVHVMVAGIDASNSASIALHEKLGFEVVGRMPQVGVKFGRWLDLAFLQRTLDDRETPVPLA